MADFAWNRLKANWYRRGLDYSTLAENALPIILPRSEDCKTFLDVGSGPGTLALPLARSGKKVTALDPSKAMLDILSTDAGKDGLKINTINSTWFEAKLKPFDAILCANVPDLLKDPREFAEGANALAKKAVFIIESADPNTDKFYYRDLYPLVFNKEFPKRGDYLSTYEALHEMGIFANVEIIEYDFDQPFYDMDEAIEYWKEYMGIVTAEHDGKLGNYLSKRLVNRKGGGLLAKFHKKAAVMWWRKARKGRRP